MGWSENSTKSKIYSCKWLIIKKKWTHMNKAALQLKELEKDELNLKLAERRK